VNLFLVMFLGGLWHGASWSYAVWGTAHGVLLAVERFTGVGRRAPEELPGWRRVVGWVVTFHCVSLLWLLFQLSDLREVGAYLRCLGTNPGGVLPQPLFVIAVFGVPVVLHHVWGWVSERVTWKGGRSEGGRSATASWGVLEWLRMRPDWVARGEVIVYGLMLFLVLTNAGTSGDFIYFQF
jgi:alginate O-acetyltransferase complex protein AlgI